MSEVDPEHAALLALLRFTAPDADGPDLPGLAEALTRGPASELLAERLTGDGAQLRLPGADPSQHDATELIGDAARDLAAWRRQGIGIVSVRDEAYPLNLRLVHDRPAALLIAGELGPACERSIAVIGTRRPSPAAVARAARLAQDLVAAGQTVVSGLAAGIDTAAHRAALDAGGRTVAVIGTGHDHAHPPANRSLQQRLAAEQAVVSVRWPSVPPCAEAFRRRNGVMSGLSRATVIVEAGERSGTRVQARLALAHGRPVCLMEPVLSQAWAAELALRPGVHVVAGAAEVLAIAAPGFGGPPR